MSNLSPELLDVAKKWADCTCDDKIYFIVGPDGKWRHPIGMDFDNHIERGKAIVANTIWEIAEIQVRLLPFINADKYLFQKIGLPRTTLKKLMDSERFNAYSPCLDEDYCIAKARKFLMENDPELMIPNVLYTPKVDAYLLRDKHQDIVDVLGRLMGDIYR